ncbi:Sec-independent protein translocase protein TatB [Nocardia sp. NPDC127579]|uniref:Sec-independent protein translocase protein TatB n=1 Tax=Nocardia sp. NPDC127579 TaxID=3345402 RepID=UPI003633C2E0
MFGIGWAETIILIVAALMILGPERLPGAIRWTTGAVRRAREYVDGATGQLRQEFGPELDEIRRPLQQLNELRSLTPQAAVTRYLLDADKAVRSGTPEAPETNSPIPTVEPVSLVKKPSAVLNCGAWNPAPSTGADIPPVDADAT